MIFTGNNKHTYREIQNTTIKCVVIRSKEVKHKESISLGIRNA